MNKIKLKNIDKSAEIMSLAWSIICFLAGMYLLNILLKNKELSDIVSVLMPLYFILWFSTIYFGHMIIKYLLRTDFYTSSIFGSNIITAILNTKEDMFGATKLTHSYFTDLANVITDNKHLPRKTSVNESMTTSHSYLCVKI